MSVSWSIAVLPGVPCCPGPTRLAVIILLWWDLLGHNESRSRCNRLSEAPDAFDLETEEAEDEVESPAA